jgi:hypothetical protein
VDFKICELQNITLHVQGGAVNRGLQSISSSVLLKFILGLKINGKCMVGCWLTIYSVLTLFFLATA